MAAALTASEPVLDVYDEMYQAALAEMDELDSSEEVTASLNQCLSNTGDPTDYEAWAEGCERFARDNYDVLKKWVG